MELYTQNLRPFLRLFPSEILGSAHKNGGYAAEKSYTALSTYKFIRLNSDRLWRFIAVDIDTHQDGSIWLDHNLPEPTWTIWTDRGVQFIWQLEKPILAEVREHRAYAMDTLRKIVYALDADADAVGYTRIFRNPFTNESRRSGTVVNLSDFAHLETPPSPWAKKTEPRVISLLGKPTVSESLDFASMREGDGRNAALFDRLRFWAYERARAGDYSEFDLAEKGFTLNNLFAEPMCYKEVDQIIASIDRFIETKYNVRSTYMANTTPEERKEIAAKNGKKGGAATAKIRQAEAWGRILSAINQLEMFEMKITVSAVAKRAKSDIKTVRRLMKEKGWKEVSRKDGWKLIKSS